MKNISLLTKLSIPLLLLFSQSCQTLEHYRDKKNAQVFNYDNKNLLLKAPDHYCFYDETNPAEKDVLTLVRKVNDFGSANISEVKILLQECSEKQNFFTGNQPRFRNTVMISFPTSLYLEELKKYGIERNRETYVKYIAAVTEKDNVKSLNQFMKKMLPKMRQKNNAKILNDLKNLNAAQKAELKLVHNELLGRESHIFISYHTNKEANVAAYNHQLFHVGKIVTKCAAADSLINYIPVNIAICEESESGSWVELEVKIKEYMKDLIKLNE